RAVIAVDLFGQPAQFPEIEKIAAENGLKVLEDGAQGFGGRIGEKCACSFGDASATSFFRPRRWAVTATAALSLRTTRNCTRCSNPSVYMERAA
ncbi:DegT/DnrJ/EryC1/StrS family aminotransferase, partial [Flavobacterium sp. 17A]